MPTSKFEVIQGGKESAPEKDREGLKKELNQLVDNYACGKDVKPEWYVYGIGYDGSRGVLYWIRPSEEAEFITHQIARLETQLGGEATAEKTEHHPDSKGTPRYRGGDHFGFVFGE